MTKTQRDNLRMLAHKVTPGEWDSNLSIKEEKVFVQGMIDLLDENEALRAALTEACEMAATWDELQRYGYTPPNYERIDELLTLTEDK